MTELVRECGDVADGKVEAAPATNVTSERTGYVYMSIGRMPSTIITIGFLLNYITLLARLSVGEDGRVSVLGARVYPTSVPQVFTTSFSFLSMIMCPMVGAVADCSPHRRRLLLAATMTSATALACAVFLPMHDSLWWLAGLIVTATFTFSTASDLLVNSYLPEIAHDDAERSSLSARGLLYGFISQILLTSLIYASVVYSNKALAVRGGQFDLPNDVDHWKVRSDGTTPVTFGAPYSPCAANATCQRVRLDDSFMKWSHGLSLQVPSDSALLQPELVTGAALSQRWLRLNVMARSSSSSVQLQLRFWVADADHSLLPLAPSAWLPVGPDLRLFSFEQTLPAAAVALVYEVGFRSASSTATFELGKIEVMSSPNIGIPIAVALCGLWYAIWAALSIRNLGQRHRSAAAPFWLLITRSFYDLAHTIRRTTQSKSRSRFLVALALYSASAGSTITVAPTFFQAQMGFSEGAVGIIMLTSIAFGALGALVYAQLGQRLGLGRALAFSYLQWVITLISTFCLLRGPPHWPWLFLIVPLLGICFGGSLTLARAVYASMIAPGTEAEMFGLFNFAQVSIGWVGTSVFTLTNEVTSSLRHGLLSQTVFLIAAFLLQLSIVAPPKSSKQLPLESVADAR